MPEKLSQSQIDALLKRISSGEVDESEDNERKIKEYDFTSPKKFTREQLKTMDSLHENFSRMLSSYLSGVLRVFCEVSVLQIEEQRYYEYNNALPDSALIGLIDVRPTNKAYSEFNLIMDVSTSIGFFMIDRLLGGPGEGYNLTRDFTDIEVAILENIFGKITGYLREAWRNYVELDTDLTSIETNSRLLQALAPEDIVVIVALNVKIRNLVGNMSICIPAVNLEEMIDSFSIKYSRVSKKPDAEKEEKKRQIVYSALTDTDLEVKAVLDEMQLDISEILQLSVEDIIPLNKSINGDISVLVDNVPWFTAKLGESGMKKAVKLNRLIT